MALPLNKEMRKSTLERSVVNFCGCISINKETWREEAATLSCITPRRKQARPWDLQRQMLGWWKVWGWLGGYWPIPRACQLVCDAGNPWRANVCILVRSSVTTQTRNTEVSDQTGVFINWWAGKKQEQSRGEYDTVRQFPNSLACGNLIFVLP